MPLVLAIQPDPRQAAILKRICREKVHADVLVVDSRDAALEGMRSRIPDVILLSALLSPRDEDELIAHLRTLHGAEHLQTHTIPQLASTLADRDPDRSSRGLFAAFRRNKEPEPVTSGCDPDLFAEEIRTFLQRAAEKKEEQRLSGRSHEPLLEGRTAAKTHARPDAEPADSPGGTSSSWASPFEWRPSTPDPAARQETQEAHDGAADANATGESWIESVPPLDAVLNETPSDPSAVSEPAWQSTESGVADSPAAWDSGYRQSDAARGEAPAQDVASPRDPQSHVSDGAPIEQAAAPPVIGQPPLIEQPPMEPAIEQVASQPVVEHPAIEPVIEHVASERVIDRPAIEPVIEQIATEPAIGHPTIEQVIQQVVTRPVIEQPAIEPFIEQAATEFAARAPEIELIDDEVPSAAGEPAATVAAGIADALPAIAADLGVLPDHAWSIIEPETVSATEAVAAPTENADSDWMRLDPDVRTEDPEAVGPIGEAAAETAAPPARSAKTKEPKRRKRFAPAKTAAPAPAAVLRLTPLAMWARTDEPATAREQAAPAEPRSCAEELRELMSGLAVPPHVADVGYARGCRIRRVRVPGGRDRRRGPTPGPVILSRRALQEHRDQTGS